MEKCNLAKAYDDLVLKIFGEGGTKRGMGRVPEDWAVDFVKRIYLIIWHREKSRIKREVKGLKAHIAQLNEEWEGAHWISNMGTE